MSDAMVTARMPQRKKEEGNRVLAGLGSNPSQAINGLYDYLIRERRLPYREEEFGLQKYSREQLDDARAFLDAVKVSVDPRYRGMSTKEAKRERLHCGGAPEGPASA